MLAACSYVIPGRTPTISTTGAAASGGAPVSAGHVTSPRAAFATSAAVAAMRLLLEAGAEAAGGGWDCCCDGAGAVSSLPQAANTETAATVNIHLVECIQVNSFLY